MREMDNDFRAVLALPSDSHYTEEDERDQWREEQKLIVQWVDLIDEMTLKTVTRMIKADQRMARSPHLPL